MASTTLLRTVIATITLYLLNTSFEETCSPPNGVTDINTVPILSSVVRNLMWVRLLSFAWCALFHTHISSPRYQYSSTNSTRYRMAGLMDYDRSLGGCPQSCRLIQGHRQHPHFYPKRWKWKPNLQQSRPQWTGNMLRYLPIQGQGRNLGPARCDDEAQHQRRLRLETPTPTCDSTTSLKSRTKRPATVWLASTFATVRGRSRSATDRPTPTPPTMSNQVTSQPAVGLSRVGAGQGHVDRHCNRQRADYGWSNTHECEHVNNAVASFVAILLFCFKSRLGAHPCRA